MIKYIYSLFKRTNTFPFIKFKGFGRASLVIVKDLSNACVTDAEKMLYKQLQSLSYYPTPHYLINGITINLALVPYKLALIEMKPGLDDKRIVRLLKKKRWNVVFYETSILKKDEQRYMCLVRKYAPIHQKNISTSS